MKRYIRASYGVEDILSYKQKEELAEELFKVVEHYFRKDGAGTPSPRITFSEYDIYAYTFRVNSASRSYNVDYVASIDYKPIDLNAFKKDVKAILKDYGFTKVKFDIKNTKLKYEWYGRPAEDRLKQLVAIYFE